MGRAEKRFQKRKDREREVRKKILKKREAAHVLNKQIEAQNRLEHEVNKAERKKQPLRRMSPELRKTLDMVEKMKLEEKDPDVDSSEDTVEGATTTVRGKSKFMAYSDEAPATEFAPKYSGEVTLEPLGK